MKNLASLLLLALPLALACGGDESSSGAGGTAGAGGAPGTGGAGGSVFSADPPRLLDQDERPAMVEIPSDYDPGTSYPLVVVLHGRGTTGFIQAGFWRMFDAIDEKQFVMVYPDGINNVWNATEACCDPTREVDDVGYISGLIEEAQQVYNIDADRVYLMGHSNGGFMSFRMACERSDLITAIVTLAGSTFDDPNDCQPATPPVSVLVVHGIEDQTVPYEGSMNGAFSFPGAVETIERFASRAGCSVDDTALLENIDLTDDYDGAETERVVYGMGCDEGLDAELWTLVQETCAASAGCNPHIPIFTDVWADKTTDWLFRHSR